jgi:SNF2 family DNA or RNA helicase
MSKRILLVDLQHLIRDAEPVVRLRGESLYQDGNVQEIAIVQDDTAVSGLVKSEARHGNYKVFFKSSPEKKQTGFRCTCLHFEHNDAICKHLVAASLNAITVLKNDLLEDVLSQPNLQGVSIGVGQQSRTEYQMESTVVELPSLHPSYIEQNCNKIIFNRMPTFAMMKLDEIESGENWKKWNIGMYGGSHEVYIERLDKGKYQINCDCKSRLADKLCEHKVAVLYKLGRYFNFFYLETLGPLSVEKEEALNEFGYSLKDENIENKFEFYFDEKGNLNASPKDKSIVRVKNRDWNTFFELQLPRLDSHRKIVAPLSLSENNKEFIYTFTQLSYDNPLPFGFEVIQGELGKKDSLVNIKELEFSVEKQPMQTIDNLEIMRLQPMISYRNITAYLNNRGIESQNSITSVEKTMAIIELFQQFTEAVFPQLKDKFVIVTNSSHATSIKPPNYLVKVNLNPVEISFQLKRTNTETVLEAFVTHEEETFPLVELTDLDGYCLILKEDDTLCRFVNAEHSRMAAAFLQTNGKMVFKGLDDSEFFNGFVIPLAQKFNVTFDDSRKIEYQDIDFNGGKVYLKDDEHFLYLIPSFTYTDANGEFELENNHSEYRLFHENNTVVLQKRDCDAETQFISHITETHPAFEHQSDSFFHLEGKEVLGNGGWLFDFYEKMTQRGITVLGYNDLTKFKYNPHKAKFHIRNSSGIDWFDLQVEVSYGDQIVPLSQLKKALMNKQKFIQLGDGSLGILPEEWLQKYGQLFKFGKIDDRNGSLKISKLHFTILEQLSDNIDNEQILRDLAEKKQKLRNFSEIKSVDLPKGLNANLRPYQEEGYKWLNFLDEFGWGGCLADDMGLGKTVQVLTFLLEQKKRFPDQPNLVVVPKTLIFNWQAEVEKFAPSLRVFVHAGIVRKKDSLEHFRDYDIVLSTYSTVRSDIEIFCKFRFHYIILDESQAIKNPGSMLSKAVKLLQANNRITMTGTPVENNTFDLYSQFEFINPGLLGSAEFFRNEYATPIDKNSDKVKAAELRRLIYPFILKRTKQEVATDLPEKTETILYCEMGTHQRKVYDAYKAKYKQLIVDKMAEVGREQAGFLILEGLMKLRQICDSPALLSDGDADYGNESAKLEEIIRELEENASNHKIVIFSQFLKMLDLIRQKLEADKIPYEYLDGQTTDRSDRVNRFQSDSECRVFLMSLKAGGVGLNLTEADYVYLIDPWWNPAVEQQAIDRVHRIGQNKKVFAYRMICKDTIEEHIIKLQNRKSEIAEDLISAEAGFLKKLSQKDILDLFG